MGTYPHTTHLLIANANALRLVGNGSLFIHLLLDLLLVLGLILIIG